MTQANENSHILVADDHQDLRELVQLLLEGAGYRVTAVADGRDALRALYEERPDLVVLDINMPELDGWTALERIRELSDVPIIMLTGAQAELEKVRGLRSGADDWVTKPFGRQELVARVEAALRRQRTRPAAEPEETALDDGLTRIDFRQREVFVAGRPVALTPLEFRLLASFVRRPNRVLSHRELIEEVWTQGAGGSSDQLKLYVGYLRRKLDQSAGVAPIETVRGFGYRYRSERSPRRSHRVRATEPTGIGSSARRRS